MAAGDGRLTPSARAKTWSSRTKGYTAGGKYDSIDRVTPATNPVPDDIKALRAALAAALLACREAEARASGAEAMVAHLKLLIARLKHDRFGASSERGRKLLDQLELQLEEVKLPRSVGVFHALPGGFFHADHPSPVFAGVQAASH